MLEQREKEGKNTIEKLKAEISSLKTQQLIKKYSPMVAATADAVEEASSSSAAAKKRKNRK